MNPTETQLECGRKRARARHPGCAGVKWLLMALLVLAPALCPCFAQTGTQREYVLKTAFLYNVLKYVEWPTNSLNSRDASPIQIGLMGDIPHADALRVLQDKIIQGRKLNVKQVDDKDASACHVVFISASEKARLQEIVSALKKNPVLTVGEVDGFAEQGGMVNLLASGNHVAMEINRQSVSQAGLIVSAQLLRLAKVFPK